MSKDETTISPDEFYKSTSLYNKIYYTDDEILNVAHIIYFEGTIDSYCAGCSREATFKGLGGGVPAILKSSHALAPLTSQSFSSMPRNLDVGVHTIEFRCTRNDRHKQNCFILVSGDYCEEDGKKIYKRHIQKIGQHPSVGDLNIDGVKKYRSILNKNLFGEFIRAIGLASHDVGIGAYVYLRRIFESLIEDAHKIAKGKDDWDEGKYTKSKISERIKLLKDLLPEFLVEHPHMYSILSKGIHELSEEDCLKHFQTLKVGIELILDEKLTKAQQEKKISEARKALGDAAQDIS